MKIPVHEIFGGTVQGEGHWAGTYCGFIRLSGCPVRCSWCDTGYANGGKGLPSTLIDIAEIVATVPEYHVVISGGEPFIHKELPVLVDALRAAGRFVQIETSGARYQPIRASWITLSPKDHVSEMAADPRMWAMANEVKIVIESVADFALYKDRLPQGIPVFVQPCDRPDVPLPDQVFPVLEVLKSNPGVRASFQVHKFIGVQ